MTTLPVDTAQRAELASKGYAVSEWIGFSEHFVPMYAHHAVADKQVGDVAFKARLGNPKTLNHMEVTYLASKAEQGFFTWKPGAECLTHKFTHVTVKPRPGGGFERIVSEPTLGCRWCRERDEIPQEPPEPADATPPRGPAVATAADPQAPALPSYDVLHCRQCPEVFVGDSAPVDRRTHTMSKHHKASTARRKSRSAPAEGSAKES